MRWHAARSLLALRDEYDRQWPKRSRASDGILGDTAHAARPSDHNPDRNAPGARRGVVRAIDLTTTHLETAAEHQALVDALIAGERTNRTDRLWYIIHKVPGRPSQLWSRTNQWRPVTYTGANPHDKHLHVSIMRTAAAETDTSPWLAALRRTPTGDDMPEPADLWNADIIPNVDSAGRPIFTGNAKNPTVTPATALVELQRDLTALRSELADLRTVVSLVTGQAPKPAGK